ncbi:AcrR family transcriptional regulator [Nakamurella sp. UYEF19]|uniref:TetR/AcrR family transcriptional regulator n=1 Tax=Nakamurella sp. UYEF19 TaxID=1756392 RepID=UPI003395CE68
MTEAAGDAGIPLYLRLLWHGEEAGRPGPKRGADLTTIADAGVRIADNEGLSAVSMRRLAAEVGFTTMALYRYVQAKSEVTALIMDRAYGPPGTLDAAPDWRAQLAAWAAANRAIITAHPWILDIRFTEPPLGPNQIGWMEIGLAAMVDTPLSVQEKLSALLLVDVYVRGQMQLSLQLSAGAAEPGTGKVGSGEAGSGAGSGDGGALWAERLLALIPENDLPHLHEALQSGALSDDEDDFANDEFAFGLQSVLDGIEARVQRRLARSADG